MKYLPGNFRVVKDNLFEPPVIFNLLQKASGSDNQEMYQVYNMGHRLEIFTSEKTAAELIKIASGFGIGAKVVGRVESSENTELIIVAGGENIIYPKTL
jgi:phosphoribosylformylglycinamidine cyclo-ligase